MKKLFTFIVALMSIGAMAQTNLVVNPNFTGDATGWNLIYQNDADVDKYALTFDDGLQVAQTTTAAGRLDIVQDIKVVPGAEYTLSFEYKATAKKLRIWSFEVSDGDVWLYVGATAQDDPFRTNNAYYDVASEWTPKTMSFTAVDADTVTTFRLQFRVYKNANTTVNLRNISLVCTSGVPTSITNVENISTSKYFYKGQVVIIKNEKKFNVLGQEIK